MKPGRLLPALSLMAVARARPAQPTPPSDVRIPSPDPNWMSRIAGVAPWLAAVAAIPVAVYGAVEAHRSLTPYRSDPADDYTSTDDIRDVLEDDGEDYWEVTQRCITKRVSWIDDTVRPNPANALVEQWSPFASHSDRFTNTFAMCPDHPLDGMLARPSTNHPSDHDPAVQFQSIFGRRRGLTVQTFFLTRISITERAKAEVVFDECIDQTNNLIRASVRASSSAPLASGLLDQADWDRWRAERQQRNPGVYRRRSRAGEASPGRSDRPVDQGEPHRDDDPSARNNYVSQLAAAERWLSQTVRTWPRTWPKMLPPPPPPPHAPVWRPRPMLPLAR